MPTRYYPGGTPGGAGAAPNVYGYYRDPFTAPTPVVGGVDPVPAPVPSPTGAAGRYYPGGTPGGGGAGRNVYGYYRNPFAPFSSPVAGGLDAPYGGQGAYAAFQQRTAPWPQTSPTQAQAPSLFLDWLRRQWGGG